MTSLFEFSTLQVSEMMRSRHVSSLMDDHEKIIIFHIVGSNGYAV
jgi:hypothetical protein